MKIGLRCSLKGGRSVQARPTRHLLKDLRKTPVDQTKKEELKKIVENKPIVDGLIQKVGKIKLKPKVLDAMKSREEEQKEYAKKLHKRPKTKISFQL